MKRKDAVAYLDVSIPRFTYLVRTGKLQPASERQRNTFKISDLDSSKTQLSTAKPKRRRNQRVVPQPAPPLTASQAKARLVSDCMNALRDLAFSDGLRRIMFLAVAEKFLQSTEKNFGFQDGVLGVFPTEAARATVLELLAHERPTEALSLVDALGARTEVLTWAAAQ